MRWNVSATKKGRPTLGLAVRILCAPVRQVAVAFKPSGRKPSTRRHQPAREAPAGRQRFPRAGANHRIERSTTVPNRREAGLVRRRCSAAKPKRRSTRGLPESITRARHTPEAIPRPGARRWGADKTRYSAAGPQIRSNPYSRGRCRAIVLNAKRMRA